jgi:hypothetical protein
MKTPLRTLIQNAHKNGASYMRFHITKAQGDEIKRIEREQGHDAALRQLLVFLRRCRLQCD